MSSVEEKIETVKSRFVAGNLLALLWIVIGTVACWTVDPIFGWGFLIFSVISVYVVIRRMLCNSCYYCKSCTKGLAKLSILFLGANRIPGISKNSIVGMTAFIFLALLIVPAAVLINSILAQYTLVKFIFLIILIVISLCALTGRVVNRNRALWKPDVS